MLWFYKENSGREFTECQWLEEPKRVPLRLEHDCSLQVPQPSVLLENWLLKALRYSERLGFMELQRFYRGMEITEKCNWLNMTDGIRWAKGCLFACFHFTSSETWMLNWHITPIHSLLSQLYSQRSHNLLLLTQQHTGFLHSKSAWKRSGWSWCLGCYGVVFCFFSYLFWSPIVFEFQLNVANFLLLLV